MRRCLKVGIKMKTPDSMAPQMSEYVLQGRAWNDLSNYLPSVPWHSSVGVMTDTQTSHDMVVVECIIIATN